MWPYMGAAEAYIGAVEDCGRKGPVGMDCIFFYSIYPIRGTWQDLSFFLEIDILKSHNDLFD